MNVYYKINYPPALTTICQQDYTRPCYPQGWYGTLAHWKPPVQIDCYDDAQGFCLVQFPVGASALPSGMQDDTKMTVMAQTAYNTLLTQEVANTTDGSNGVWTGNVLVNRNWSPKVMNG